MKHNMDIQELIRLGEIKKEANDSMLPIWREVINHSKAITTEKGLLELKEELSDKTLIRYDSLTIVQIINMTCDRLDLRQHRMSYTKLMDNEA